MAEPEKPKELKWKSTSPAVVKAEGGRKFTFTFSSGSVDRDRDVIDQQGIDLGPFKANPVVLWAHSYMTPPIGRVSTTWFREGKLMGTVEFAPKGAFPLADSVHDLVAAGFVNATSIGFSPQEWTYDEERRGVNYKRIELWEVSIVPVPSNRDAMIEAAAKGIEVGPVIAWAKDILGRVVEEPQSNVNAEELAALKSAIESIPNAITDSLMDAWARMAEEPKPVVASSKSTDCSMGEDCPMESGMESCPEGEDCPMSMGKAATPKPQEIPIAPRKLSADQRKQLGVVVRATLADVARSAVNSHSGRLDD